MKRIVLSILFVLFIIIAWNSCAYADSEPFFGITSNNYSLGDKIDKEEIFEVEVNKTMQLYFIGGTENDEGDWYVTHVNLSGVTWSSENPEIATVDSTGKVTGIALGEINIYAEYTYEGEEKYDDIPITIVEAKNPVIEPTQEPTSTGSKADFSKTKITLAKDMQTRAMFKIENLVIDDSDAYTYYVCFSDSDVSNSITSLESFTALKHKYMILKTAIENGTYKDAPGIEDLVEQNKDIYACIVEANMVDGEEINVKSLGKVSKPVEPKYADAFNSASYVTSSDTQILVNFTHGKNARKMQIKVGKITDNSILNKIKNNDISGFESLLTYAKNNSGIYDQIVDSTDTSGARIEYNPQKVPLPLTGKLDDDGYYYLYVKTLDENGKWVSNEAVTLAQADVYGSNQGNSWYLFFYGASDFKWVNISGADPTVAPTKIPQTGQNVIIAIAIVSVIGLGVYTYRRLKNYSDIR